jgi:hypothetical protein
MRLLLSLILIFLFQSSIVAQTNKCNKIMKREILNIEISNRKIYFTKRGVKKILNYKINDTVNILGIKFLVADGNASYFPNMPVLFIPSEMKGFCLYSLEHLNSIEKDKILAIISGEGNSSK